MTELTPVLAATLAQRLLAFYDARGRDLPWRGSRDLYRIWVSEIMLQQTGVATVIPYYERFLRRFPDLKTLAATGEETVLSLWQGLGYYSRARNLLAAARQVMADGEGAIPEEIDRLVTLPGIGPSTAAAILAIGRDQPHAILDGNVKRVLARLLAFEESIDDTPGKKKLLALAQTLTPRRRPGDYAQAIMDLGATLCTPRRPDCDHCPWRDHCRAVDSGRPEAYPVRRRKTSKPRLQQMTLLIRDGRGRLLFGRRPSRGLLGGMWDLPSGKPAPVAEKPWVAGELGLMSIAPRPMTTVRHTFTHFHLLVTVYRGEGAPSEGLVHERLQDYESYRWLPEPELADLPISTLHRKILQKIGGS